MILFSLSMIFVIISAFFPAYLWYQPEHAWVGYVFTIWFALCSYIPWIKYNKTHGLVSLIVLSLWGIIIETIGLTTCRPYGCFSYSEQLWPLLVWWAPWLLLATYPPLVLGVYQYIKKFNLSWRKSRIAGWIGLMLVDLVLDPIAVMMWLRSFPWWWFWFGVPLSNFIWRIISGTVATMILDLILHKHYNSEWKYSRWMRLNLSFFIWYLIRFSLLNI